MAIYHAHIKSFSRGKGESSVAAAAYRAGIDLTDKVNKVVHRYSSRKGVSSARMLAPIGAPSWCLDERVFWSKNDAHEKRSNARVAREIEVSLPHELCPKQREKLAIALGQEIVDRFQAVVLVAIHEPSSHGDQRNHHVHILMSARKIGPNGFGDRAGADFDAQGLKGIQTVRDVRERVGKIINTHLSAAGINLRVDHRSLKDQAIAARAAKDPRKELDLHRCPTQHIGKVATAKSRALVKAAAVKDAMATMADSVNAVISKAIKEGRMFSAPAGHDHSSALDDRLRETKTTGSAPVEQSDPIVQSSIIKRPTECVWRPGFFPSLQGEQLSKALRSARARGEYEDALYAHKEEIQRWLAAQNEAAEMAIDRMITGGFKQFEPAFSDAIKSLQKNRANVYGGHILFFHDSEELAFTIDEYVSAMRNQHDARHRLSKAQSRLTTALVDHRTMRGESALRGAQRELAAARTAVARPARDLNARLIIEKRREMTEVRDEIEHKFHITDLGGPCSAPSLVELAPNSVQDGGERQSQSNQVALKPPKPRRPGSSTSIFGRH